MLKIMLCGAADTSTVADQFSAVVHGFGGDPLHFVSGQVLYLNNANSSWRKNSIRTIKSADIAIFVVIDRFGEIAWGTELRQAIDDGTPFAVLCAAATYRQYLLGHNSDPAIDHRLADLLRELETDRSLTIVQFDPETFEQVLRRELSRLLAAAVGALTIRNRREALAAVLGDPAALTPHDLTIAAEVAVDEFEDKGVRKAAVRALASRNGADEEAVLDLVRSLEQGVSRLSISLLSDLYRSRPVEPDFIREVVELTNESDDVGVSRRLVLSLFDFPLRDALAGLTELALDDIGTRRRITQGLDERADKILAEDETAREQALELVRRCLAGNAESPWIERGRQLEARLAGSVPGAE